jgi:hypothetical protein
MEIKDEILLSVEVDGNQNDAVTQMEKLKRTILETKREQMDLQDAWKKGQLTADEYVKETVRLENSLKKSNAQYSETQKQVTGVKSGMDKLIDSNVKANAGWRSQATTLANQVAPGLTSSTMGMWGMVKASLAFIATPIGAVLAAVGLALVALISYFKGSEEGGDKFARVMAQAGAIVDVLTGRLIKVGEALFAFLSGNPAEGVKKLNEAFTDLGDEMEREVGLAGELADIFDILEEMNLKHSLAVSESANQIKLYLIQAKDLTKTEAERLELQQKALDLQRKLSGEELALRTANLSARAREMQMKFSQFEQEQKIGESTIDFAKRLIANDKISLSARQELSKVLIELNNTQGESLNVQEKIINQQDKVKEKLDERIAKEVELNAQVDKYVQGVLTKLDADRIAYEEEVKQSEERTKMSNKFIEEMGLNVNKTLDASTMITQINKKTADQDVAFKRESVKIKKMLDDNQLSNTAGMLGQASSLFKEHTMAYKVTATAEAVINTYLGASKAAAEYGFPLGPIFAAIMVAQGLMTVAKINGVKLARGGDVQKQGTFSGPDHSRGGIKYFGTDGRVIEVEGDENFYVLKKSASRKINQLSALNVSEGGNSFGVRTSFAALGGQIETTQATQQTIDSSGIQSAIINGMAGIKIVAQVEDIRDGISKQIEIEERANSI